MSGMAFQNWNKQLLSTYCTPGTVLEPRNTVWAGKKHLFPDFWGWVWLRRGLPASTGVSDARLTSMKAWQQA